MLLFTLLTFSLAINGIYTENVLTTEVFEIEINPDMFNWTFEGIRGQYVYQPSLKDAPDLPKWINYIYSHKHNSGFLYGVPPNKMGHVNLDVVALNRKTYETRKHILPIHITEKLKPAKYEVQLKIDNLNVDDMFDLERMDRLKDVFRKKLWKDSDDDLYVTFLASAIELGARLPVNPTEGEGVVLRIGSRAPLSNELIELQEEVKPLWKVPSCPRDFKRTTVERYFRDAGFNLDWCAFRLLEDNSSAMQHSRANIENHSNVNTDKLIQDHWETLYIDEVPERSYKHEFLFTILVPMFIMTLLALILSLILCFHNEGIVKDEPQEEQNETLHNNFNNFETIQKATNSLRNYSTPRDFICMSPESTHMSYTNSPTNTLNKGHHCRPSPPPYVRPKYKPEF
ncbi:epsilon-sarcoglycan-like isoform X2 [Atheta coriaria]|uniref:epsilon-sarcoglycan-like isoform X2 n=1 Tax=Dalotia coriaria TaxID=877792 RepID=UPI0031F36E95